MKSLKEVFLFVSTDKDGNESIPSVQGPLGLMPLLTGDENNLVFMRKMAQEVSNITKQTIRLMKYEVRTEMEIINPGEAPKVKHEPLECPACHAQLTGSQSMTEGATHPSEGCVTVCTYCESVLRFTKDTLVLVSEEELDAFTLPEKNDLSRALSVIRNRKSRSNFGGRSDRPN